MTSKTHIPENDLAVFETLYLLAEGFYQPTPELSENLRALPEVLQSMDPETKGSARRMLSELENQSQKELLKEYSRLFLGPFQLEAPPFGSVYLEDEVRIMGESTAEAQRMYRESGLDISPDFNSPPDHVAAELEFLAYLGFQEKNSQEASQETFFREQRALFLHRHIGRWFPLFAENVEKNSDMGFYLELIQLTRQLLKLETENFESVLH